MLYREYFSLICFVFILFGFAYDVDAKELKSKTYKEDYKLDSGDVLEGNGVSNTKIKGMVRVRGNATIKNLTIEDGGIFILKGAHLVVENVTINDAVGTAIDMRGGSLVFRNSSIIDPYGKAFYLQRGSYVTIVGNTIRDAGEEGIDIRDTVSGVISGNTIIGNKESGIEVILGRTQLKITNNTISNNGSSGIATQYYNIAKDLGNVVITNNVLNNNRSYGINCKTPSGGHPGDVYWDQSTTVEDNTIIGNKEGMIARRCRMQNVDSVAVRVAREKAQKEAKEKAEEEERKKAEEEAKKIEIERREKEVHKQREDLSKIEQLLPQYVDNVESIKQRIDEESGIRVFFLGIDNHLISILEMEYESIDSIKNDLGDIANRDVRDEELSRIKDLQSKSNKVYDELNFYIDNKKNSGIFRFFYRMFK